MRIHTDHFGELEIENQEAIRFPAGLPGFENNKLFTLIGEKKEGISFFYLQSLENGELCFVVTDPFSVYPEYEINLPEEDVSALKIEKPETLLTLAMVIIPDNMEEARVNLRAPIVINAENKTGKQLILNDESLPQRFYLSQIESA